MSTLPPPSTTLRYRRGPDWLPHTQYHWIAVILWVASCAASVVFVQSLGVSLWLALGTATLGQWMLTRLESPIWHRRINVVSLLILLFDVLINAGGLFYLVRRLDQTQLWTALTSTGAVSASMSAGVAYAVAFVLGLLLAAAPEIVWSWN